MSIDLIYAMIFLKPFIYESSRIWMLLPLTLAIAVVYKTTRLENLRAIPMASFLLWSVIIAGMIIVGALLYAIMFLFLKMQILE